MATRRGFTDHEHLDEVELIHMNGRVYDYNVGRFLSVDPIVHSGSQGINPYSYIMNNPLSGTDPSGYMPEKEIKVKFEAKTGSRLGRTKTVTATATESGGVHLTGGSAAAQAAVAGAINGAQSSSGGGAGGASSGGGASEIGSSQSTAVNSGEGSGTKGGGNHFSGTPSACLLYTSPSPRDQRGSRMPSSA